MLTSTQEADSAVGSGDERRRSVSALRNAVKSDGTESNPHAGMMMAWVFVAA